MKYSWVITSLFVYSGIYGQSWKQYVDDAEMYINRKNNYKAIELYNKAMDELQNDSSGTNIYTILCIDLANVYLNTKQYEKAEELYLKVRQIQEKLVGKGNYLYIVSCYNLALLYFNMKKSEKVAEPLFLEAIKLAAKSLGKEHYLYTASCYNLSILYYHVRDYEKAEPLFLEVMSKTLLEKKYYLYAASCSNLALLYYSIQSYEKAEPLFLEAIKVQVQTLGKEHPDYATSCDNLASLYFNLGQYKKAEPLYVEAKQIRERVLGKNDPYFAASCNNLALLYYRIGYYEKAETLNVEARDIRGIVLGKEHPDYAKSCIDLASNYYAMGQYEKSEGLYLEGIKIQKEILGKENPTYINSINNLAVLYFEMGQFEKSEELFLEAIKFQEKVLGKKHSDYAQSCSNLASHYMVMGQYERSEQLYLEAKDIRELIWGNEHPDYAQSCHNLALLYHDIGQYEKSEQLYIEAIKIQEKVLGKDHPDYAHSATNLASHYMNIGQYEKSEPLYIEAIKIQEKILGKNNRLYAVSCTNLASLYVLMGKYKKAESLYLQAKQIQRNILGTQHPDYAWSCSNLANLYWLLHLPLLAEKEFEESFLINVNSISSIFNFTSEKEKSDFVKRMSSENDRAYSFYISEEIESAHPYTLSLFHRNLILSSLQIITQHIFSANDTNAIRKYNEWVGLKKYFSILHSRLIDENNKHIANEIEERANRLEKELAVISSELRERQQTTSWKSIKDKLKINEVSIEFSFFKFYNGRDFTDSIYYVAIVLRKDSKVPKLIKLFEKRQIDTLLNYSKYLFPNSIIDSLYTRNKSLYNLIWKPLEKHLNGITKVYFASAGDLFKISFAALLVKDNLFLSDIYQLVQLNTTADIIRSHQSFVGASDNIQLYGGVQYDVDSTMQKKEAAIYGTRPTVFRFTPNGSSGFKYLSGTLKEINQIKKQADQAGISTRIFSNTNALEESIKTLNGNSSPSVLHIATHGFFFPDPNADKRNAFQRKFETSGKIFKQSDNPLFRAGLIFTGANNAWIGRPIAGIEDGILTAYEMTNLYLPNTKLAVLSACETALGDIQVGEGVYGLQRALKMAGVQNLIMSLWKVPDMETAEFMELFYNNLFGKQSINDAFYNAQSKMRTKYRHEPNKWAAWVLVR
ncbi:MAG: CHAT domain-containing tetratricopeptide repeat protein [Bacteroidota bacterium]